MRFRVSHLLGVMSGLAILMWVVIYFSRSVQLAMLTASSYAWTVWILYDMREKREE